MPGSNISMQANVRVAVRKFYPDDKASEVAMDGTKGRYGPWIKQKVHNLLTDAGRDFLHQQGYETTGLGTNGGNYIAITTNSGTPADGDTVLSGEITTGGLARAQGTVSHTTGTNSTTVIKTFTASATHTSVQKSGLFTASSSGTLVNEAAFTAVTLENLDQLQLTWTVTLDD